MYNDPGMKTEKTLPPPPSGETATTPASPAEAAPQIWIRPPIQSKRETCAYTGLGHSAFYGHFVGNPRIRQARMGAGKARGTRLLWLPDIFAELARMAEGGKQ
jgi:hypothetical protein